MEVLSWLCALAVAGIAVATGFALALRSSNRRLRSENYRLRRESQQLRTTLAQKRGLS